MINPALFVVAFIASALLRVIWVRKRLVLTARGLTGYRVTKSVVELCWAAFYGFVIWTDTDTALLQSISRFIFVLYLLNEMTWHGTFAYAVWTRNERDDGPPG